MTAPHPLQFAKPCVAQWEGKFTPGFFFFFFGLELHRDRIITIAGASDTASDGTPRNTKYW